MTELVSSLPDGINTELAEGGGNISGGQKKRIAVARALIRDCDTLLIDEMTSSLDIETTDEMVKLILSLSCTVIMITHGWIFCNLLHRKWWNCREWYLSEIARTKWKFCEDASNDENNQ